MGKEVETVHSFEQQAHRFGLKKIVTVVRCDDGSVYEFVKGEDEPNHRLATRFKSDGTQSTYRGLLPDAVSETLDEEFGDYWTR